MNFIQYLAEKYSTTGSEKEKWITVYHDNKPYHVLINGEDGTILSGLGGSFTGKNIRDFYRASAIAYVKKLPKETQERLKEHYKAVNNGEPIPEKDTIYGTVRDELRDKIKAMKKSGLNTAMLDEKLKTLEENRGSYDLNTVHFSKTRGFFVANQAQKMFFEAKDQFKQGKISGDDYYRIKQLYDKVSEVFSKSDKERNRYADEDFVKKLESALRVPEKKEEAILKAAGVEAPKPKPEKKKAALAQVKVQEVYEKGRAERERASREVHKTLDVRSLGLSEDTMKGIYAYTGSDYADVNRGLRSGSLGGKKGVLGFLKSESHLEKIVSSLDEAMKKSVVKESFVTYRGMYLQDEALKQYLHAKPGDTIRDNGFISTSTNPEKSFSGNIQLEITVPKGTRGAVSVNEISRYKDEEEVVLNRGGGFKIISVEDKQNYKGEPTRKLVVVYVPKD